jgi:anti-sigma factor RsiW
MVCETWKTQLDVYLDGELPSEQMHEFDAHVRSCAPCAADALVRVQLKRCVQAAGKRFAPALSSAVRCTGQSRGNQFAGC